ncbi:hypothetical protein FKM82_005848 [Ascaphus truei]
MWTGTDTCINTPIKYLYVLFKGTTHVTLPIVPSGKRAPAGRNDSGSHRCRGAAHSDKLDPRDSSSIMKIKVLY